MLEVDEPAPAKFRLQPRTVPIGLIRKAYLTPVETKLCQMLADGFSPKEIARKLKHQTSDGQMKNYAMITIKNTLLKARQRCYCRNTPHLIAAAYYWGYIT